MSKDKFNNNISDEPTRNDVVKNTGPDLYTTNSGGFKDSVDSLYQSYLTDNGISTDNYKSAANRSDASKLLNTLWSKKQSDLVQIYKTSTYKKEVNDQIDDNQYNDFGTGEPTTTNDYSPFDIRLSRLFSNENNLIIQRGFDYNNVTVSKSGFIISDAVLRNSNTSGDVKEINKKNKQEMDNDPFYQGVPSLVNAYSITKLYGSNGGQYLLDRKDTRKWYDITNTNNNANNVNNTINPTTSTLISWGEGDPHGRTPYSYSDFAFCKFWRLIPNNRMITLRRYPAPILDNLNYPGMDGVSDPIKDFPPMASAITYFGDETGNDIKTLLKFSVGLNWDDVTADMHKVTMDGNVGSDALQGDGAFGSIFGHLTKLADTLNIATGNFNASAVQLNGGLPPDPYQDGPYENRVMGPVNRIDSVKKRKAGLNFTHKIELDFEYIARPIGGINAKAALLDIMSNFLTIGYASALFWGGQHRFMGNPAKYPFLGGNKGIESWYRGDPIGWGKNTISQFTDSASNAASGTSSFGKEFFSTLFSGKGIGDIMGSLGDLFSGNNIGGNLVKNKMAKMGQGQVPYLLGMKALLTGEPVGEWHLTVGNPLNPIAMIGNLICTNMEFEWGDELGPDDFPLSLKIHVTLENGMARDRDAVQSIFNRGMGRIYDLPDYFTSAADYQTEVDKYTKNGKQNKLGQPIGGQYAILGSGGTTGRSTDKPAVKKNPVSGDGTQTSSVWNRTSFQTLGADESITDTAIRPSYRSLKWIAQKSHK